MCNDFSHRHLLVSRLFSNVPIDDFLEDDDLDDFLEDDDLDDSLEDDELDDSLKDDDLDEVLEGQTDGEDMASEKRNTSE